MQYSLCNDTISEYIARVMHGMVMNNSLENMWKEAVVAYCEGLSCHLLDSSE